MTRYRSLHILLPCHSLEDFPTHHIGVDAQGLLENWTALWHPSLIQSAQSIPKWHRAEEVPDSLDQSLILVPSVSDPVVPANLDQRASQSGSVLIRDLSDRKQILTQALEPIEVSQVIDPDIVADFLALGYGFLQVQLMTRQLRYSSNLDEARFQELVVEAANAASGPAEETEKRIQRCVDLLLEEKGRYYPVEANLIDLTLLAKTTLGKSLREQLQRPFQQNLLMTGDLATRLEAHQTQTLDELTRAVSDGRVELVGGNRAELPDPLLSLDTIARGLKKGRETIKQALGREPEVYVRRRTGLFPCLPELLEKLSYRGALHASLDEGRFPTSMSTNSRWEAPSGESIPTLGRPPVDASVAESFLNLGVRIGEAIDSEHYATVVFAHWPNQFDPAFEDLLRIHKYGPLLGNFVSFTEHFDSVYDPGFGDTRLAHEYRNAYLKQAVEAGHSDPISTWVRYWTRLWRWRSLSALHLMASVQNNQVDSAIAARLNDLLEAIEGDLQWNPADSDSSHDSIDDALEQLQTMILDSVETVDDPNSTLLNPVSFTRNVRVATSGDTKPSGEVDSIQLRDSQDGMTQWIVKGSSLGHTLLDSQLQSSKSKLGPSVVDEGVLQNEFFRVLIDQETGGVRGVRMYDRRTNLLTQRLSARRAGTHPSLDRPEYAQMIAEQVSFRSLSRICGQAVSNGMLKFGQTPVAEFQQTVTVTRGSRLIDFDIQLQPLVAMESRTGWDHYLCNRFAWWDESAIVNRELHFCRSATQEQRLTAPGYLEITDSDLKLTFVTGGLPYHQRSGVRQLDSILITQSESERRFRFALAVNPKYSSQCVADWMSPPVVLPGKRLKCGANGWLFHFSSRNVVSTGSQVLQTDAGKVHGVRFRLQETEGRRGALKIHCPFPVKRAISVDLSGNPLEELKIEQDRVLTDFLGSQMLDIEIYW